MDNLIKDGIYSNWKEVVDSVNQELYGDDEEKHKGESAYRKAVKYARDFYEAGVFETDSEIALKELEAERIKIRDERTALRKEQTNHARASQKLDYLEECLSSIARRDFRCSEYNETIVSNNDLLVVLSDLHIGEYFNNKFGEYNVGIAEERLSKYVAKISDIATLHNSENCYISIQGDLISGNIHKSIAITNRENVIDQVKIVTELIATFCHELAPKFKNIYIHSVSGNHSRIDKKADAIHDERLDDLVSWALSFILKECSNITVVKNATDTGIAEFNIRGKDYIAVHGEFDSFSKSGVSDLVTFLKKIPYAIVTAHLHTCALEEFRGIKMIRGGSLGGSGNQNTIERRLVGEPSQMVCVCNADGILSCYPVNLK